MKTRVASSATKKENEIEIEKEKKTKGEKVSATSAFRNPRSSTTTEYMEPCSFGDEDFVYQPGAASSLREGEEEEEEEEEVIVHRRPTRESNTAPSRIRTDSENQAKQPLLCFHSKNFKVEVE